MPSGDRGLTHAGGRLVTRREFTSPELAPGSCCSGRSGSCAAVTNGLGAKCGDTRVFRTLQANVGVPGSQGPFLGTGAVARVCMQGLRLETVMGPLRATAGAPGLVERVRCAPTGAATDRLVNGGVARGESKRGVANALGMARARCPASTVRGRVARVVGPPRTGSTAPLGMTAVPRLETDATAGGP